MHFICQICGREYTGLNCLACTQQAILLQNFGEEAIGEVFTQFTGIVGRAELKDGVARLKLTSDGQLFAVPRPTCRIGKDTSNDIVICEDDAVAKFHAQISFDEKESEYVLRDLGTKEGTWINGAAVRLDETIFDGDILKIGAYKFYFFCDDV